MRASVAALVGALTAPLVSALGSCDIGQQCVFQFQSGGSTISYDLRGLCNPSQDYVVSDNVGHTYYAQICGTAGKSCLPLNWVNQYQYGATVQTWGSEPLCNTSNRRTSCVDQFTNLPVCCSEDCEVVGLPASVTSPVATLLNAQDPGAGIMITMVGEQPTASEPNQCDIDPSTGAAYIRTTHFELHCDSNTKGYAVAYEVVQDPDNGCDYTIRFRTNVVCSGGVVLGLSGGWVFNIILFVCAFVYVACGAAWSWLRHHEIGHPHAAFWSGFSDLIFDGLMFAFSGCSATRAAGGNAARRKLVPEKPAFFSSGDHAGSGEPAAPAFGGTGSPATKSAYTDL